MSFMAALTAAAPVLIPAAIGAAGGAGLGALTSEDGFSDDGWWQGMLAGGLTGGIGGGMGMFSPAGGGLMGGSSIPSSATTGLSSSPIPFSAPSAGGLDAFMASVNGAPVGGFSPATSGGSLGNFLGSTSGHGINFLGAPTDSMFGGLSGLARGDVSGMMPSNDTMMKGLLGSQIFKGMTKQDPKKEWTPQQARIAPISKMGAPMQLSRRGGQPGGAFMGGGPRGSLGSRRYS
jgi:hypothetical protein